MQGRADTPTAASTVTKTRTSVPVKATITPSLQQTEQPTPTRLALLACAAQLPGQRPQSSARGTLSFAGYGQGAVDAPTHVPLSRWDANSPWVCALSDTAGTGAGEPVRFGAWLPDCDMFDAHAFGLTSATEVQAMDPQQRLLLTLSAEALAGVGGEKASAGLTVNGDRRGCGVFVGVSSVDYLKLAMMQRRKLHCGQDTEGGAAFNSGITTASATGECFTSMRLCPHLRT